MSSEQIACRLHAHGDVTPRAGASSGSGPRLACFMHMNVITNARQKRQDREQPRGCHPVL